MGVAILNIREDYKEKGTWEHLKKVREGAMPGGNLGKEEALAQRS